MSGALPSRLTLRRALLLALGLPGAAWAQRIVPTLDVGGSSVRYADSISDAALVVAPAVRLDWSNLTLGASSTLSQLDASWSSQGLVTASLYSPADGPLVGELAGTLGGSLHQDGSRTGQTLLIGRAHLMGARHGVWGGVGAGSAWDGSWRLVRLGEAGAWAQLGAAIAVATLTPTVVDDTVRYADAELALRWELPRVDVGVSAGHRAGSRLPTWGGGSRSWGSGSVTAWVAPRMAVVASVGAYPVDPTQGFPGGRYVSLAVRFGLRGPRSTDREPSSSSRPYVVEQRRASDAGVSAFELAPADSGRWLLRVRASGADAVELGADFTDWQPVRLAPAADGWWIVRLPVASGTHQMNVRVNGGAWIVPPGLTLILDEFGGAVGVLAIP